MSDASIRLELDVDGWRPTVTAELIQPPEYGLAVHESPWGQAGWWWVSDVFTGRRYAVGKSKDDAMWCAVNFLSAVSCDTNKSIQDVLSHLRKSHAH